MMIAWTPSLLVAAYFLWRAPVVDFDGSEAAQIDPVNSCRKALAEV